MSIALHTSRTIGPSVTDTAQYAVSEKGSKAGSSPSLCQRVKNVFTSMVDCIAPISPLSGRRQLFTLIPEWAEIALGKYVQKSEVVRQGECYDKQIADIVEGACQKLIPVMDRKLPFQVKVI